MSEKGDTMAPAGSPWNDEPLDYVEIPDDLPLVDLWQWFRAKGFIE